MTKLKVGHWTVRDYDAAVERGTFGPEPRIELLRGEIYEVSPIGPRHGNVVRRLLRLAVEQTAHYEVGCQDPVIIGEHSEPQPDLWIARPGGYSDHHPSAGDLALVVEVSDSTLHYDRFVKTPTYIAAGIPEVWVVDLVTNVVWTYTNAFNIGMPHDSGLVVNQETGVVIDVEHLLG